MSAMNELYCIVLYCIALHKTSPYTSHDVFSSLEVFNQLNTLGNTWSGPDEVPVWFLRLASPFIAKPVAYLFNQSLFHSVVPHQSKRSVITPVAKVALPSEGGDFLPISVTSILSRMMEKLVTKHFYYPMLDHPQQRQHFFGPICLLANWIYYGGFNCHNSDCVGDAGQGTLCPSDCNRSIKGIR